MKPIRVYLPLVCVVGFFLTGCGSSQTDEVTTFAKAKPKPAGAITSDDSTTTPIVEPTEKIVGGMKFEIPAGWEEKALSGTMIHAEYGLPSEAGPGRLTLSTARGGVEANIRRWKSQFQRGDNDAEPKESQLSVAGTTATMLEMSGAFTDMFDPKPKLNWQLIGVAVPIDSDNSYFVKLTGPRATIEAHRDEFLKFVDSAEFK